MSIFLLGPLWCDPHSKAYPDPLWGEGAFLITIFGPSGEIWKVACSPSKFHFPSVCLPSGEIDHIKNPWYWVALQERTCQMTTCLVTCQNAQRPVREAWIRSAFGLSEQRFAVDRFLDGPGSMHRMIFWSVDLCWLGWVIRTLEAFQKRDSIEALSCNIDSFTGSFSIFCS
jgi:hypothetical protein